MWSKLFVVVVLTLATAGAAEARPSDYCTGPVRVAMFEFGILYSGATDDGIDRRLLDTLTERTGCTFKRVLMPRARIWAELQAGSLDMATAAVATPERQSFGYLLPYMVTRNLVLVRKEVAKVPTTLRELENSNLRLGVVRGFKHEPAFDTVLASMAAKGQVKQVADVAELFKYLERRMVDVVFSQPTVFRLYLDSGYVDNALVIHDWAPREQVSVGNLILSRKSFTPEQARQWDRLLSGMVKDGSLQKVIAYYLPSREAADLVYSGPRKPD